MLKIYRKEKTGVAFARLFGAVEPSENLAKSGFGRSRRPIRLRYLFIFQEISRP